MLPRFHLKHNPGGMRIICDRKTDTAVALIYGHGRPEAHTERMIAVILDALNRASQPHGQPQEENTPEHDA